MNNQNQIITDLQNIFLKLVDKKNLTVDEAKFGALEIFEQITDKKPDVVKNMSAFFGGLTAKDVTVEELTGISQAMDLTKTYFFDFGIDEPLVTAGGTGGDSFPTINVTTPAVIIAAAAGAYALKSGAKAFSSKTGSSDLSLELGINIHSPPEVVKECVKEIKLTCWASECVYPWMAPLIEMGKNDQIQKIMPMLYSLRLAIASALNPFSIKRQVRGVSKPFTQTIAQVLSNCGYEKALVVLGYGEKENIRIDEISNIGKTIISELKTNGKIETYQICPEDFGIRKGEKNQIMSKESHFENAKITYEILSGKDTTSRMDLILINSAAILYTADKVKDLKDGYQLSKKILEEGKALEKLWQLVMSSGGKIDKLKTIIDFN